MVSISHSIVVFTAGYVGDRALLVTTMQAHLVQECWRPAYETTTFWTPTGGLGSLQQTAIMEHERLGRLCLYVGPRAS